MFKKILIANRGDQPALAGAAAKPERMHMQRAQRNSPRETGMFRKILIANRGDQPALAGAAAKPERMTRAACAGDLTAGERHV